MGTTDKIETKFTHHKIGDNELKINGKVAVPLEPAIITVGVQNPDKEEIVQKDDGTYYKRVAVESKEVYNKKTQKKRNWFILALETGKNPKRYFPGAEVHGLVSSISPISVYSQADINSEIIGTVNPDTWVIIKNIAALNEQPDFYKIATSNATSALVGYIRYTAIKDNNKIYENLTIAFCYDFALWNYAILLAICGSHNLETCKLRRMRSSQYKIRITPNLAIQLEY